MIRSMLFSVLSPIDVVVPAESKISSPGLRIEEALVIRKLIVTGLFAAVVVLLSVPAAAQDARPNIW
jgi:hypothetical protein